MKKTKEIITLRLTQKDLDNLEFLRNYFPHFSRTEIIRWCINSIVIRLQHIERLKKHMPTIVFCPLLQEELEVWREL